MNYLYPWTPSQPNSTRCRWSRHHIYASMLFALCQLSMASPIPDTTLSSPSFLPHSHTHHPRIHAFTKRAFTIVGTGANQTVIDPNTRLSIPQGPASDGSGFGYDAPAIMWIVFCLGVGVPLAFAGIRGWRITTGVGVGIGAALPIWAALVNSMAPSGLSDIALTCLVLGFFIGGFAFGVLKYGRVVGKLLLAIEGGLALAVLIMIVKSDLLLSGPGLFSTTWALIGTLGVVSGMGVVFQKTERIALLFSSASVGSFLSFLGADLIINQQTGMSRGLRFLFDRNKSHALDILGGGYTLPFRSQLIIIIAIAAIPVLAVAQHFIFKGPFDRSPAKEIEFPETTEKDTGSKEFAYPISGYNPPQRQVSTRSRISNGFWDSFKATANKKTPRRW